MGILDRKHTHEDGTEHSHEGGDKAHTHNECTCTSEGRDIECAVTEHSG